VLPSSRIKKLHFVGIGGSGMSGIAEILFLGQFEVSGSDMSSGSVINYMKELGIKIFEGHKPEHVEGCDIVVYSSAVKADNVELKRAKELNIPVIRRAEMLGELMRLKYTIAIAGTHGKTTTTSMVGHIWNYANQKPTIIVGGIVKSLGSGAQHGEGNVLIAEADEYDKSFLQMMPSMAILTNIEEDHLDCYNDLDDIKDAFVQFLNKVPFYGQIIACLDDEGVRDVIPRLNKPLITYGFSRQADFRCDYTENFENGIEIGVSRKGEFIGSYRIQLSGRHNILNSLASIAVAMEEGIEFSIAAEALKNFTGVKRRFEQIAQYGKHYLIDDYAHHPTEVSATLEGARSRFPKHRIRVLFQPHLYSRTQDQYKAFASAFLNCDELYLAPIYGARESYVEGVGSCLIADSARDLGHHHVNLLESEKDLLPMFKGSSDQPTLTITMGAGPIWKQLDELQILMKEWSNGK
jgi:UDP-N-acetylmuramate--alanine ligase